MSRAARSPGGGWDAEQDRDDGVEEQGAAGQGVRARPPGGGQVERVQVHARRAQVHVRAPDGTGEAGVLVLGVDHPALGALVQGPEDLQLGEVRLPGAGRGEGDGVVVRLRPPVPGDQPGPGGVDPVQHPGQRVRAGRVAGQVGAGEREAGGERGGVHGAAQHQLVGPGRQRRGPPLQGAEGGRDGDQQQRRGQGADRLDLGGELVLGAGVDGQVQAEAEQLALAPGQPVGQLAGVGGGGLGVRVVQPSPVGAVAAAGLQPGALAAQPGRGHRGGDRLDVQRDVEAARVAQQRLQPARADLGGVAGDGQGGGPVVAGPDVPRGDLDGGRAGHVPARPAWRAWRRARRVMRACPGW